MFLSCLLDMTDTTPLTSSPESGKTSGRLVKMEQIWSLSRSALRCCHHIREDFLMFSLCFVLAAN